jgi:hypothetical protein
MKKLLINAALKGAKKLAGKIAGKSKKSLGTLKAKPNAFKGVQRPSGKGGTLKPKPNAFKGVQSAGAARNAPARAARAARGNRILAGTAAGLGAAVVYNKSKSPTKSATSPVAVAPKKKPTNVVMPRKAKPVKAAPKKAAPKAKAKPRAASFTPTAKKTPLSVSKGKKKVGYVKSNRSGRGGLRTRGR